MKLKKVISKENYYENLLLAVNTLCNPVISTLGPKGDNVLISNSTNMPFITNDGVTIAKNINSEDEIINAIIEILKEASLKTDEEVGDGTTTTLVLLKSLILKGIKEIQNGEKPIMIKRKLDNYLKEILDLLDKEKIKTNKSTLEKIARTSSADEEIGKLLASSFSKVKAIKIKESNNYKTYVEKINGYYFDAGVISNSFLMNQKEVVLDNCYLLILDYYVDDINKLSDIYNMMIEKESNLIILADSISEEIKQLTLEINLEHNFKIILLNSIDYVEKKKEIYEDLEILTKVKVKKEQDDLDIKDLGFTKQVKCSLEQTIILGNKSNDLNNHLKKLIKLSKEVKEKYYLDNLMERINKLKQKMLIIYVGGYTKTEKKEKMMRFFDALCSLNVCSEGVLYGSGITLLKISEEIDDKLIKETLESPIRQILENNNLDDDKIIDEIKKSNYTKIYNVKNDSFEKIIDTDILDAYLVVRKTLETAFSLASMILTTSYLVLNIEDNLKENISF